MGMTKRANAKYISLVVLAVLGNLIIGALILSAIIVLPLYWAFTRPNWLAKDLNAWTPAMRDQIAICYEYPKTVNVNGKTIDIKQAFDPTGTRVSDTNAWEIEEIFCVYNNSVYGIAINEISLPEDGGWKSEVEIFAVDADRGDCRTVYTAIFAWDHASRPWDGAMHPGAYYYNGTIVLYEGDKVVSLDLENEQATEYGTEDFIHPTDTVLFGQADGDTSDPNAPWVLSYGGESRTVTLDFLAERNEYAAMIKDWERQGEKKMKASGFCSQPDFLAPGLSVTGTDAYLWYYVLDRGGDACHILFRYDFEKDIVTYIGYGHTRELGHPEYVYPIPIVQP